MRNKSIDCMRGIGIFLVVLAHAGFPNAQYIELFHMSVFFIISGFCHNETYSENIQSVILFFKKRLKSLYVPYVCSNLVLLCAHNLFYDWNIYTDNPCFLQADIIANSYGLISSYSVRDFIFQFVLTIGFVGGEQLSGTLWFLRALFEIEIFYVVIDWIGRKFHKNRKYVWGFVSVVILIISYFLNTNQIHIVTGIETSCYYFIFFIIGIGLQKINLQRTFPDKLILLISAGWILVSGFLVTHSLIENRWFPPFYIMNGLMGGLVLKILADISIRCTLEGKFLEYLGKHSMTIMLWHFLSFKIISVGYIKICGLPDYYLASFPYLDVQYLWIAYLFAGILLPLLANYVSEMVRIGYQQISVKLK